MLNYLKYPCSTSTLVEIGVGSSRQVIDAALLRWKPTSQKTPLYNYNLDYMVAVARGHTIVSGILGVNFITFGYLYSLIEICKFEMGIVNNAPTSTIPTASSMFSNAAPANNYYDSDSKTPVFHNTSDIIISVTIKGALITSTRSFSKVQFLGSELAVDAKSGDSLVEIYEFIGRLDKPVFKQEETV
jgi:hypothetical protein